MLFENVRIDVFIYIYMIACSSLMVFNFAYVASKKRRTKKAPDKVNYWIQEVMAQFELLDKYRMLTPVHTNILMRRLVKVENLVNYAAALSYLQSEFPENSEAYLTAGDSCFCELAQLYASQEDIERAYYADFLCQFALQMHDSYTPLNEILLTYMRDANPYCRENTLRVLYKIGNKKAVVNALQIINDRGCFHHNKLISDGLATFSGDKIALGQDLWQKYKQWSSYLMTAVMQFLLMTSDEYKAVFLPVLQDEDEDIEMRLAAVRYYRRYTYEPARPILTLYAENPDLADPALAIVSVAALERYPGGDTREVLKRALSSAVWHVRLNAVTALVYAGETLDALYDALLSHSDRYAQDIIRYKLEQEGYLPLGVPAPAALAGLPASVSEEEPAAVPAEDLAPVP